MTYSKELREAIDRFYAGDAGKYEANVARAARASEHEATVAHLEQKAEQAGQHTNLNGF